jgi:hypothetical protein
MFRRDRKSVSSPVGRTGFPEKQYFRTSWTARRLAPARAIASFRAVGAVDGGGNKGSPKSTRMSDG